MEVKIGVIKMSRMLSERLNWFVHCLYRSSIFIQLENYDEADFRALASNMHRNGGLISERWFRLRSSIQAMSQVASLLLKAESKFIFLSNLFQRILKFEASFR